MIQTVRPISTLQDIPGFFNFEDLYDEAADRARDGDVIVEVGSFYGRSACYLAGKLRDMKKKVTLLCVDNWADPEMTWGSTYELFRENVQQLGLLDIIVPICTPSVRAAAFVKDNLDFVFIDAAHDYENCLADIKAWLPKVKKGGVIAGHDIHVAFPGVKKAVEEMFAERYTLVGVQSWLVQL